ncbi:phage tail terminator family protein [Lacticaseibacillus saniviri]|uniref:phage tail terminator family protein n=1 Tax=Lacticaseibacillus saniviri TaxID=931533 RepID=UPI0007051B85|nr:hypothetical protein [Lacticaseibacillus saniviri]
MEDITNLIARTIKDRWPDLKLYRENQASGFSLPSFYLHRIRVTDNGQFMDYRQRVYSYQLVYFPPDSKPHAALDQMAEELMAYLIEVPNYAKLMNRQLEVQNDALSFTFDLNVRVVIVNHEPVQNEMEFKGGIKHGRNN